MCCDHHIPPLLFPQLLLNFERFIKVQLLLIERESGEDVSVVLLAPPPPPNKKQSVGEGNTKPCLQLNFRWKVLFLHKLVDSSTPFTKASPNYPHKNNADNSIQITFTNSELPKIIRTLFYERPLKKTTRKDGRACRKRVTFDRTWEIIRITYILELRSQIPKSGPDNCSVKGADFSGPILNLWPNDADIIRIIEFVNEV